ncbi:acyltransferase family protein [Sphingomonas sp. TX0543]|uniref:acyltransferase family protein n=1 Tax=unclassified Sphingomonas TaxID=196159 RepID=UPI0010F65B38|nr:acyltransferase [Sphingomonas sp. 3P27F8]
MPLLIPRDDKAQRSNNFDAIRLAMALLVVWSHSFALWFHTEAGEWISLAMAGTYNAGNLGVLAFFAISGFLITASWQRSTTWRSYLKRRVMRIYPGYLIAVTLCSLVIVPAFSSRAFGALRGAEMLGIASNLLLRNYIITSDAFGGGAVNGSLWSIPYEFWCYLGVMALGLCGVLRWRPAYLVIAIGVMAVRVWLDMTGRHPDGGSLKAIIGVAYFWFNVLPPFVLGGAAYIYRDRVPRSGWLLAGLVAATLIAAHLPLADPLRLVLTRLLLPPTLVYGVLYLAFDARVRMGNAARFGDFSYGCYLYAFPIQQMLVALLRHVVPFPVFVIAALACSLAAGVASWYLVERWFLPRVRSGPDHRKDRRPLAEETTLVAP